MRILLWLFCGFTTLGAASFIYCICFPGKVHNYPEGYKNQGGEQSEPNPGESVTEVMEECYYASYKQNQFSNN